MEQLGSSERSSSKLWRRVRDSTRSWLVAPTTRVGQPVCRCVGERACARSVTRLERPAGRCSGSHRGHLDLRADRSGGHHRRTGLRPLRAAQKPASAAQLEPAHQPHHVHGGGSSVAGAAFITINEWNNPATLGELHPSGRLLAGSFQAVTPRTAGFNSLYIGQEKQSPWLGTIVLMFIGGGSASTAGEIKVTTCVVLLFAILAKVRGESAVNAFERGDHARVQRQALTIALLSVAAVVSSTLLVIEITRYPLSEALFEVTSAFATVGLSTAGLPSPAELLLVFLMFLGRLGPITLVTAALAVRDRERLYHLPEGRPVIG